jgi:hypothetical protein
MPSVQTRLERLEKANSAEVRCVWLYVGWGRRGCPTDAGDGVYRAFVPDLPAALPQGLLVVLRHSDRDGAEVSAEAAHWVLTQLALSPRQRALIARAKILVLITAGGPEPPPAAAAADVAPPEAEVEPLPAAERPPPTAAGPSPPPAPPPPVEWPEWLPR